MAKIGIDITTFEIGERDFPEVCKFCLEEKCDKCQISPERKAFIQELLEEEDPTLERYETEI